MKKTPSLIFFLSALIGFILWAAQLLNTELSHDEPFSVYHAQLPIQEIIRRLALGNNPPLYEIVLHFWMKIFGNSLFTLRLLSTLFIALSVFINAKMMLRFFSLQSAIISSILFIFSNFYLLFAQEARGYALFLFLVVSVTYLFLVLLENAQKAPTVIVLLKENWQTNLLFIFTATLLLCTHYMSAFVAVTFGLILLALFFRKMIDIRTFWAFVIFSCCILILYSPQLVLFITNMNNVVDKGTWLSAPQLEDVYNLIWKFSNSPVATICLLFPLLYIPAYKSQSKNNTYILITSLFWIPLLTVFIVSYKVPLFHDRYMIFISPFFYNLISVNTDYFLNGFSNKLKYLAFAPVIVYLFSFNIKTKTSDKLQQALQLSNTKKTCYVVCPPWYNYTFYYYFENGKYFNALFDYKMQEPKNVFLGYNLSTFNFDVVSTFENVNVILGNDAQQVSSTIFTNKLTEKGFKLDTTSSVNKATKSYFFSRN